MFEWSDVCCNLLMVLYLNLCCEHFVLNCPTHCGSFDLFLSSSLSLSPFVSLSLSRSLFFPPCLPHSTPSLLPFSTKTSHRQITFDALKSGSVQGFFSHKIFCFFFTTITPCCYGGPVGYFFLYFINSLKVLWHICGCDLAQLK